MTGRVLTCVGVLALGVVGVVAREQMVLAAIAWLGFVLVVLDGFGTTVIRVLRLPAPGTGLRMLWGATAYVTLTGGLVAAGVCNQWAIRALLGLGAIAFCVSELRGERPRWRRLASTLAALRGARGLRILVIALGVVVAVQIVSDAVEVWTNLPDDDVAYRGMVRRLLDVGNLDEPFSYRRLSAYGGQAVLHALAAARGSFDSPHLIDRGVFQALSYLLLLGLLPRARAWSLAAVLILVLAPSIAKNTASYWSGLAFFLGGYQTLTLTCADPDVDDPPRLATLLGLVAAIAAATGSLRHSYLPVAVLLPAFVLGLRLHAAVRVDGWRLAWRKERRLWLIVVGVGALCLAPWAIASWRSSSTLLYPLMRGTFSASLVLQPHAPPPGYELHVFAAVLAHPRPIFVLVALGPLLLITRDRRRGRPLTALAAANVIALALLIHAFTLADAGSLWRYGFGYVTCLALVVVVEIGAASAVRLGRGGRTLLGAVVVAQLAISLLDVVPRTHHSLEMIAYAAHHPTITDAYGRQTDATYAALQGAIPPGTTLAVLIDDVFRLDFARNRIAVLDLPGLAGPGSGLPSFRGPLAMRTYLRAHGIRYVAFERRAPAWSLYRRRYWMNCVVTTAAQWTFQDDWRPCAEQPTELANILGAYIVDAVDTFTSLATTQPVLVDRAGLVVVDLGAPTPADVDAGPPDGQAAEYARRQAWVHTLAE